MSNIFGFTTGSELRLWASQLRPGGRNPVRETMKERSFEAGSWELCWGLFHEDQS